MSKERIIENLEYCRKNQLSNDCKDCEYGGRSFQICERLVDDILVLLKEQEAKTHGADSGMCEICSFYERALPVKPHCNARTYRYECGACRYSMTSGMDCRGELIPAYKVGFCAKCGKAVKLDD